MRYLLIIATIATFSIADFIRIWAGGNMPIGGSSTNTNIWIMGKHFIPLVPNIRIEQSSFKKTQNGIDESTELIAYYNLLDNTAWTTLDIGAGVSMIGLEKTRTQTYLSFVRARVEIPLSSIGIEAIAKNNLLSIGQFDTLIIKADIEVIKLPMLLDIGLEAGFRTQNIKIDGSNIDNASKDYFIGVVAKF